jgi:hypothetical protein
MSDTTTMRDFIERLHLETPPYIHPSALCIIHEHFCEMRESFENPAHVAALMAKVRDKVALELRFLAENCDDVRDHREAWRLRRRVERFEARHG